MKRTGYIFSLCGILLVLGGCSGYRTPSTSGNPEKMSDHTLCYRYATAKKNANIADEVARRRLDCAAMLDDDPLYTGTRY